MRRELHFRQNARDLLNVFEKLDYPNKEKMTQINTGRDGIYFKIELKSHPLFLASVRLEKKSEFITKATIEVLHALGFAYSSKEVENPMTILNEFEKDLKGCAEARLIKVESNF